MKTNKQSREKKDLKKEWNHEINRSDMGNVNIFGTFSNLADLKKSSGTCLPTLGSHEEENFLGYQQKKEFGLRQVSDRLLETEEASGPDE